MRALVLSMALMVVGCASSGGGSGSGGGQIGDVTAVGSQEVAFVQPGGFDQEDRAQVVEAVRRHLSAWEADFGWALRPTTIMVVDAADVTCGGISSIGCYDKDTGRVTVVRGDRNSLPALYHEFCHRAPANSFYGADVDHDNPAWPGWTQRSLVIAQALADERSPRPW